MKEAEIFINQIGYKPLDSKNVFVSKAAKGELKEFTVCKKADGQVVFTGALIAAPEDELSGGGIFTGDIPFDFQEHLAGYLSGYKSGQIERKDALPVYPGCLVQVHLIPLFDRVCHIYCERCLYALRLLY